jgi:hypothetical protein
VQRALVASRLLAVSTTVLALGSGAHVLAGGHAPSAGVVALLGALVLLAAAALARRPLTVRVLLPVAVASQVGVHVALTWLAPAGEVLDAGTVHGPHGSVLAGDPVIAADTGHAGATGVLMPAAHAVAMAATVLLLVATERGVLALVRRWSALLPALGGVRLPVVPAPRPAWPAVPGGRRLRLLAGSVARRGPPAPLRPRATA